MNMNYLERNWWVLLVRGIAAILFGIAAFAWPGLTAAILVVMFGAYMLIDGLFGIIDSIRYRETMNNWWLFLLEGALGVIAGLLILSMPGITALVLVTFIAFWAILGGILRVVAAIQLRKEITGEWMFGLGGALSILFGVLLIAMPGAGLLSLVWLIGIWAFALGVLFIALAFRLRKTGKDKPSAARPA